MSALQSQLRQYSTPRYTDAQIKQMALNRYLPEYNAQVQGAKDTFNATKNSLQNQLAELNLQHTRNSEALGQQTANAYASANRQSLSRGMQRSSYNNANLNNINLQGVAQQNKLNETHGLALNDINSKMALGEKSLADTLARLANDKQYKIGAYEDELRDKMNQQLFAETQAYNSDLMNLMRIDPDGFGIGSNARASGGRGGSDGNKPTKPTNTETTTNPFTTLFKNALDIAKNSVNKYGKPVPPKNTAKNTRPKRGGNGTKVEMLY